MTFLAKFLYGKLLRLFAKFLKNLSSQSYGVKKISSNFHPDCGTASKGIFRGPVAGERVQETRVAGKRERGRAWQGGHVKGTCVSGSRGTHKGDA